MSIGKWVNERTGISDVYRVVLARKIPKTGWAYTLGSATLFVMVNQIVTGILLSIYYVPTPDHAWGSVNYIQNEVLFGWLIRGLHHYGASAMVIFVGLHMIRVVVYGAYKYPREVTWTTGVVLLIVTMAFGFTGYLLPWDQKAYWATTVGTQFARTTPVIGNWLLTVVQGGENLSAVTLARFFGTHVWVLPAALLSIVGAHLYLVIRLGITNPPWKKNQPRDEAPKSGTQAMNEQEKREYDRSYKASKHQGEPFYPNAIIKDALVALFIFLLLVALSAFFRAELQAPADPTNSSYIPHPEWYFLFLYEMLKFFPGDLVILGVIVLPGVVFLILFLLPWLDRRADRHPRKRPAIMALLTFAWTIVIGFTLLAFISAPPPTETATAVVGLNRQQTAIGQAAFVETCSGCHGEFGEGGPNPSKPGSVIPPISSKGFLDRLHRRHAVQHCQQWTAGSRDGGVQHPQWRTAGRLQDRGDRQLPAPLGNRSTGGRRLRSADAEHAQWRGVVYDRLRAVSWTTRRGWNRSHTGDSRFLAAFPSRQYASSSGSNVGHCQPACPRPNARADWRTA